MKPALLDILACPRCKESLDLRTDAGDGIEVHEGTLRCPMCGRNYRITGGIPRFVENGSYAASFGRQWQWFRRVQLDSQSGSTESARTLEATTGWTEADYRGRLVLDAGVGAGRFAGGRRGQGRRGGRRGSEPRRRRSVREHRPAPQCAPRAGRHHGHALSRGDLRSRVLRRCAAPHARSRARLRPRGRRRLQGWRARRVRLRALWSEPPVLRRDPAVDDAPASAPCCARCRRLRFPLTTFIACP